ncbi:MAG TPA: SOS response-associated peptidase [Candidatus Cloacimonadota bacterium]|jgi:putative SOS response-associated peptidase YedK|nr:SOS response-associated peptidase [Candidatus Cloacimonadales bacterium]HPY96709.1 SOS response-associated peptidase [Candidatus Cloacimonadota bacterium]HQB41304.1 SOS response-associated peptidase [Candidatus Cloacimonadota bacterium]
MCGQFALYSDIRSIIKYYEFLLRLNSSYNEDYLWDNLMSKKQVPPFNKYNFPSEKITPSMYVPLLFIDEGEYKLDWFRWGLVPSWSKDESYAARLINARLETIEEKPSFKEAWKKRRCLIPCNHFYEWDNNKVKHEIKANDEPVFSFGGLWESWKKDDIVLNTFTIITYESSEDFKQIHERSPLVINKTDYLRWLNADISKKEVEDHFYDNTFTIKR